MKNVLKKNKVYHNSLVLNYLNGAEEKEFDESMLTPMQREWVDAGLKTLEDFKPRTRIVGNRVEILRISSFDLTGAFENGLAEADMTTKEFAEEVFTPVIATEEDKKELENGMNPPEEEEKAPFNEGDDDDDLDDLFG